MNYCEALLGGTSKSSSRASIGTSSGAVGASGGAIGGSSGAIGATGGVSLTRKSSLRSGTSTRLDLKDGVYYLYPYIV